ncbi:O-acyltransferase like protein-like isoform X2 [Harmonia axyridis]|uniref:O-acyltransferase like protein-like isoform X2 n=1 Tax=Harmonia axyridis TaxID=115357 RepID=UPI001E274F14|nr:O-acyltransferase like protein-like isoform X2 [Harmonia axyridis]
MVRKVHVWFIFCLFGWCYGFNGNASDERCSIDFRWKSVVDSTDVTEIVPEKSDNALFEIWKKFSLFSLENVTNISEECSSGLEEFTEGIKKNEMDYIKMFDATGKLPSGILRGNVNQFGDFDECLSVDHARYCLAELDFQPNWISPYEKYKNLVHSHFAIRETFDDVKHRVPGFSMVRWGFCIPKKCSASDLEIALSEKYGIISRIKPEMCQIKQAPEPEAVISLGDIATRCLFGFIIFLTALATIRGYYGHNLKEKDKLLQLVDCFNLIDNFSNLTTVKDSQDEVKSIHGVRALGALALIIAHKTMALFYNPYINRSTMSENLGMRWSVIGRTAILYTDGFMLISGFLSASILLKELEKGRTLKFKDKLITRIFRISPNMIAMILFCTYILPHLGIGPLWPIVVGHHSHLCKNHMWRNMLYIHNFFPFQDMCLTHTHQVGIDMQLFLITPLVINVLWSSRKIGLYLIGTLTVASTLLRFIVTWNNNLSHVVHFGITISRMFDTANLSYILPTHRATIYFMGVFLAYIMRNKSEILISKERMGLYWTFFMFLGFGTWLGPIHMSHPGYVYSRFDSSLYGAISPITFGAAVSWAIYATEKGHGGFLGGILAWDKFKYFTKISYAVYLVQFPLFFYNIGKTKHADEFSISEMFQVTETIAIIVISILLTVFIELPFQKLRFCIFKGNDRTIHAKNKGTNNNNEKTVSEKPKKPTEKVSIFTLLRDFPNAF